MSSLFAFLRPRVARRCPPVAWAARARAALLAVALPMASVWASSQAQAQTVEAPGASFHHLPAREVLAPHYGDVLFQFFQTQHFSAISSLMVSQQFGRLAPHDAEAELLLGGMLLSYGLHREANQRFEQLLSANAPPGVQDRAWFHLARLRALRGLYPEAAQALARIPAALSGPLEDQRQLLQGQVAMALGQFGVAAGSLLPLAQRPPAQRPRQASAAQLAQAQEADTARDYARYNLGVALLRSGDRAAGQQWLDRLGQAQASSEEQRALRDQANLLLGYTALQAEQHELAETALARVRLASPQARKALLGVGWAVLGRQQPRQALVPWAELAGLGGADPAVLEARLALAHGLAQAGAPDAALAHYQAALAYFLAEHQRLEHSIDHLLSSDWIAQLLALNPGADFSWLRQVEHLPPLPHPEHLGLVLAEHGFQELFKNERDLTLLQQHLDNWQARLGHYHDMLDSRRQRFAQRLPAARAQAGEVPLQAWAQQLQALRAEQDQAEQRADGQAFASAEQMQLRQRLQRSQATVATLQALPPAQRQALLADPDIAATDTATEPKLSATAERLRLAAGALDWQLSQAYPERAWPSRKALQDSQTQLRQAAERLARLNQAEAEQQQRFAAFDGRIASMTQRLASLRGPLAEVRQAQQLGMRQLAVAALRAQQQRLQAYASQARLAMAQLQDLALTPAPTAPAPAAPTPSETRDAPAR